MPVGTEPVNAMRLIFGCFTMASPAGMPLPLTILATPGGKTSLQISPSSVADSELVSGGLMIAVLPAISGPARPRAAKLSG